MRRASGSLLVDVSSLIISRRSGVSPNTGPTRRMAWSRRAVRGSWTRMDVGYVLALFVLVILNLLDITITLIHTDNVGWDAEGNLLIKGIAETYGEIVVVLFKLALVAVTLAIMWNVYRRTQHALALARNPYQYRQAVTVQWVVAFSTLLILSVYVLVVSNNVVVVWG